MRNLRKDKILHLKQQLKADLSLSCQLFDLPSEFYMSTFTAFKLKSKIVPFTEYAEKRNNYEFLKEFNTLNL